MTEVSPTLFLQLLHCGLQMMVTLRLWIMAHHNEMLMAA